MRNQLKNNENIMSIITVKMNVCSNFNTYVPSLAKVNTLATEQVIKCISISTIVI